MPKCRYFAMFSTLIDDVVGKCTTEGIDYTDFDNTIYIELTKEQFDNDELTFEDIKSNRRFVMEEVVKYKLKEVEFDDQNEV